MAYEKCRLLNTVQRTDLTGLYLCQACSISKWHAQMLSGESMLNQEQEEMIPLVFLSIFDIYVHVKLESLSVILNLDGCMTLFTIVHGLMCLIVGSELPLIEVLHHLRPLQPLSLIGMLFVPSRRILFKNIYLDRISKTFVNNPLVNMMFILRIRPCGSSMDCFTWSFLMQ